MCNVMRMFVSCVFVVAMAVTAQATLWTGTAGDGLWNTAGNWDAGVPGAGGTADITTSAAILLDGAATPALYSVQQGFSGGTTALTVNTDLTTTYWYVGGYTYLPATATIIGGTTEVGVLYAGYWGASDLHLNGGMLKLGYGAAVAGYGTCTLDIAGGALSVLTNVTDITTVIPANWTATANGGTGTFQYSYDVVANRTTITAIPEPATMVLLGLGGLSLIRRKR